jgi:glycerophosphoryl diester phosphodiesterase
MWLYPKVLAHRGGGILAPENTLAAMRCGLDHGFRAVEFDVMLSNDGIPILMHDPEFGRTVKAVGEVAKTQYADLKKLDAGAWFDARFIGEPIPSYEDVVRFCRANRIWMNVEIKPAAGEELRTAECVAQMTKTLFADVLAKGSLRNNELPLFSSFSFDALLRAREIAPEIPRGLLVDQIPSHWRQQLHELAALSLHTNHHHLTQKTVCSVKDEGYSVFCYTVNTPERAAELFAWGVDSICTDRIDLISADLR